MGCIIMDARGRLGWFYVVALVVLIILCVLPPLMVPDGTVVDIGGRPGRMDNGDLWSSMDFLSATVYSIGDMFCHQMGDRTMYIGGNEIPICVREFSMVLGALAGMISGMVVCGRIDVRLIVWTVASLAMVLVAPAEWIYASFIDTSVGMAPVWASGLVSGFGFALLIHCIMSWSFSRFSKHREDTV